MILPYGIEGEEVRRLPWVTFTIMGICLIMFIFTTGKVVKYEARYYSLEWDVYFYYNQHPYLKLDPDTQKIFDNRKRLEERLREAFGGGLFVDKYSLPEEEEEEDEEPDEIQIAEEQAKLDEMLKDLEIARDARPYFKWGFVPAKKKFITYITHIFMHGGFWHLLMNMFFLYIMGPFLEDVWGKPMFAVFFLATGILAAQAFGMHYPHSMMPSIGASGAIAGLMGGVLIRYWNVRLKFFYLIILVKGTFKAPTWLMLPLWLLLEITNASIMDAIFPEGGGGVAYWAHIWGFIFGTIGGLVIKFTKFEEKYIAPKVKAQTSYVNKSSVLYDEAMQLLTSGERDKAYGLLKDAASEDPTNQEIIETLWNLGSELGKIDEVAPYLTRLTEREAQQGRLDMALFHFRHLRSRIPNARLSTAAKVLILQRCVTANDPNEAQNLLEEVMKEVNLSSPPGLLLDLCRGVMNFDVNFNQSRAPGVVELCLKHPDIPDAKKNSIKEKLDELPKLKQSGAIKIDSKYDSSRQSGMGGLGSPGAIPVIPVIPTAPTFSSTSIPSQLPPIPTQGPEPIDPEAPISIKKYQQAEMPGEKPEPIDVDAPIPIKPQETGIPIITSPYDSVMPIEPGFAQPPPVPPEAAAPQEHGIPMESSSTQPPPIPPDAIIPLEPVIPAPTPPSPKKNLRVTKAVPLGVKEGKLSLNVENMGQRLFPLEKIKGISVVKISPMGERPYLLIDLLIDDLTATLDPTAREVVFRTIRLSSTNFNPQKFFPSAPGPLEAFKVFTSSLLKMTGAKPFPDLDSVQLHKVITFSSIKDYESSLLEVSSPIAFGI